MPTRRSTRRGAPRGQRPSTAVKNADLLSELEKGRSRVEVARERAGNEDRFFSWKQSVYRAEHDAVEIPEDPADLERLLDVLEAGVVPIDDE